MNQRATTNRVQGEPSPGVEIPPVPEELRLPVQSLLRAADGFRVALARVGQGMDFGDVMREHQAFLRLCMDVVDLWAVHLGIDFDRERAEDEGCPLD
jgi:hypothetical protein